HRRAQPAHRDPRAAERTADDRARRALLCGGARALPRRGLPARAEDALAVAHTRRGLRRLSVPQALHLALPLLARRRRRARTPGCVGRITNHLPWQAWLLGAAVSLWVAGFDCFYALFDLEIDRAQGLHSIATRFGVGGAFAGARISHAATVACLVGAGLGLDVGVLYWLGVAAVGALLVYEHSLVRPTDLRRLDAAFFTMNGVISVVFA